MLDFSRRRTLLCGRMEQAAVTPGADNRRRLASYRRFLPLALRRLPPQQRQVLELFYLEGLSRRAIGERLGLGRAAVSRRLRAADEQLRQLAALAEELGCFDPPPGE